MPSQHLRSEVKREDQIHTVVQNTDQPNPCTLVRQLADQIVSASGIACSSSSMRLMIGASFSLRSVGSSLGSKAEKNSSISVGNDSSSAESTFEAFLDNPADPGAGVQAGA